MKFMRTIFSLIVIFILASACRNNNEDDVQMSNGIALSVVGNAFMAEDDTEGVTLNVLMAFAPTKDETIELTLEGNEGDIVHLDHSVLHFKAKQKEATVKVISNAKHALSVPKTLSITIGKMSDPRMKAADEGVKIVVTPDADIPVLTPEQQKLIAGYKEKFGFDLTSLLGKVPVETTVLFNNKDKEEFFKGKSKASFKGFSIITLSEKATADAPILKIVDNPMGLTSFCYDVLKAKTVEDHEYFLQQPYGSAIVQAINYDATKEQVSMSLDNIKLIPSSGGVEFVVQRPNLYDEMISALPFVYYFSAWERVKELRDKGTLVYVKENGKIVGYQITDEFLLAGGSIDPQRWLGISDISRDTYNNTPSDWVTPKGHVDFTKGTMTFVFPWDFEAANGYQQVRVTYTMHK